MRRLLGAIVLATSFYQSQAVAHVEVLTKTSASVITDTAPLQPAAAILQPVPVVEQSQLVEQQKPLVISLSESDSSRGGCQDQLDTCERIHEHLQRRACYRRLKHCKKKAQRYKRKNIRERRITRKLHRIDRRQAKLRRMRERRRRLLAEKQARIAKLKQERARLEKEHKRTVIRHQMHALRAKNQRQKRLAMRARAHREFQKQLAAEHGRYAHIFQHLQNQIQLQNTHCQRRVSHQQQVNMHKLNALKAHTHQIWNRRKAANENALRRLKDDGRAKLERERAHYQEKINRLRTLIAQA